MTAPLHGKVLLYEDFEYNICEYLGNGFKQMGFETEVVSHAEACLEAVHVFAPDVVFLITNNVRRHGSAFEIARTIRQVHPRCGFVFVSGQEWEDVRVKFRAEGYQFEVHLLPCPIHELKAFLLNAIDSPLETFVIPGSARNTPDSASRCRGTEALTVQRSAARRDLSS